jgi:hypothetical protein
VNKMKISIFESIQKAYVVQEVEGDWPSIRELLMEHQPGSSKNEILMYNLAEFKSIDDAGVELGRRYHYDTDGQRTGTWDDIPGTVRRCKNNIKNLWGIVLDVDGSMTIPDVVVRLEGLEYVLYTTFNHSPEDHRFRVVIPFSQPLAVEHIAGREASIRETFPGVDGASFSASQSFYFHSGVNDPLVYHNQGEIIDPYEFAVAEPPPAPQPRLEFTDEAGDTWRTITLASLLTCRGLHYSGPEGDTRNGVLTLISMARSAGLSFEELWNVILVIAAPDSKLRQRDVVVTAWQGWSGDRITRARRDEFVLAWGGRIVREVELHRALAKLSKGRQNAY